MTPDLCDLSAAELTGAYRDRSVSPVEVAGAVLARIGRLNPPVNAFTLVDPETTLRMARASEARWRTGHALGPADGIPVTVKDTLPLEGWPAPGGSLAAGDDRPSAFDSASVARLREAGGVFVGKTATPEFSWKGVTDSPRNGATRNPWARDLTAGGSSGGAGAAAALGLGAWHLATDAAGSIRIPAAFCGVCGFKPTYGVVPVFPFNVFGDVSHHGPIARSVGDLAAMMSVISRPDPRAAAAPPCRLDFGAPLDGGIAGWRIAYAGGGFEGLDPEIGALTRRAVAGLADLGAEIEEVTIDLADAREEIEILWRVGCALIVEGVPEERRALLDPGLRRMAELGRDVSGPALRSAQLRREGFAAQLQSLCADRDLLVTPTVPIPPFAAGHDVPPGGRWRSWIDWTPFTYPFNLSRQPAVSLPCGLTARGLPAGLQMVGAAFDDLKVLRAARAFEEARPFASLADLASRLG